MSSILKVNTIQDLDGNLIISKDSGGSGFLSPYASSSAAITYTVTVASKTSAHPYFGVGSSNGYLINGIEAPIIEIKGNDTSKPYHYKFDQSDSTNNGHPLLFYNNVGKTTQFTTGVTTNGTPGQAGAYTMIAVDSQTPNILYYQCSQHANMGNHTFATSPVVNTGVFLTLPTADGSSGQFVKTNGSGVLAFADGSVPDNAITLAKMASGTDGNIISYDASGNPVAVATGNDGQVLTSAGAGAQPAFETLPAGTTLSGSTNNTVATVTGANALIGEANLLFSGNDLTVGVADNGKVKATYSLTLETPGTGESIKLNTNGTNERMRVNGTGSILIGTTTTGSASAGDLVVNGGVFLGGTAAANELDDYEEGNWTPGVTFGGGNTGVNSGASAGSYTKVGRLVMASGLLLLSSKGSSTGNALLTGLPFTAGSGNKMNGAVSFAFIERISFNEVLTGTVGTDSTTASFFEAVSGNVTSNRITNSDFNNATGLRFTITYQTN